MQDNAYWIQRAHQAARVQYPHQAVTFELLPPQGSLRRYVRTFLTDRDPVMLMLLPPRDTPGSEAGTTEDYAVRDAPFVQIANWLARAHVPCPAVYGTDEEHRAIWLEDLGTDDFDTAMDRGKFTRQEGYHRALDLLQQFQQAPTIVPPPAICQHRRLDEPLLLWELHHYREWRLEQRLGCHLTPTTQEALANEFAWLAHVLSALPQTTIHRDFQSHNIMCPPNRPFALLDFQDCLQGPLPYDAVALLRDSYIELTATELEPLLTRWAKDAHAQTGEPIDALIRAFHLQTVQRKLKDTGRFEFFALAQEKSEFLAYRPASVRYIRHALEALQEPKLRVLSEILATHEPLFAS